MDTSVLKQSFQNLKWFEWMLFATMIIIGGYYMITDQSHPMWYLVINYISSIAGVCCIFLCAHASWPNWIFAIVNTVLYIIVLAYNHVYGTMALELLYYMPTNVMGLVLWKRHLDNVEPDKCMTKVMNWTRRIIMVLVVLSSATVYHYILVRVGGATAWLDALIVAIGIIATFLELKRFADQYYLWLVTDVIAVIQWVMLGDVIMITKKSIYLIMAVIGLLNWIRLQRERNAENI